MATAQSAQFQCVGTLPTQTRDKIILHQPWQGSCALQ